MKIYKWIFSLLFLGVLISACQKFDFTNPWDANSKLSSSEWSPSTIAISNPSITSKLIKWELGDFNVEGFYLDRKVGNGQWLKKYKTLAPNSKSWTDEDIIPDTTLRYYYRITSFAGSQTSSFKESQSKAQFSSPEQFNVQKISEKKYLINWQDKTEGEEGFEIWKQKNNEPWQSLVILPANETSYMDTNVFYGKEDWDIRYKINAFYQSYSSADRNAEIQAGLAAPTNLSITKLSNVKLDLSWQYNSEFEEGFIIERQENDGDWNEIGRTSDFSFMDTSFLINATLRYRVSAYINNYLSMSSEANHQSHIIAPVDFLINKNSDYSIDIEWTYTTSGHDGFKIDRKVNSGEWELEYGVIDSELLLYTDEDVDIQNNDYSYRIYAYIYSERSDYLERVLHIPEIGEFYAGGYVYYLNDNVGGMVVGRTATIPLSQWGCWGTQVEATGEEIGDGLQNTLNFISTCDEDLIGAWSSYNWEDEGYDDWFLPSKESLQLIYENIYFVSIGGFQEDNYWSSSEYNETLAWDLDFRTGNWSKTNKTATDRIRSVRKF